MKRVVGIVLLFVGVWAHAEERIERGKVTYVAAGTVYTSLGRESGVQDSTQLFIVANRDTIGTLKVFAVSSRSSACWVVKARREPFIGDDVIARVIVVDRKAQRDSATTGISQTQERKGAKNSKREDESSFNIQGRVSAQYFTSLYSIAAFNSAQPGIALNVHGSGPESPFRFDVYANLRSLSVGSESPFSSSAINQSRIYGLSLTYDDHENAASIGRIIPSFSPSIGYIDGALLSRRFGNLVIGTTLGYQPDFSLRGISTDYKKLAVFAQLLSEDRLSFSASLAYARTYFHSSLDREATSLLLSGAVTEDFSIYANTEVDLREKSGGDFVLSPHLTGAYVNLNYRITNSFSMGLGADASRPYYSFESVREVPDSFLVNELRGGLNLNVSWMLPGGISLYNAYTPRNSPQESFGKDFSNYASLNLGDLLSTGVNLRVNATVNANYYTSGSGYGAALQKTFGNLFDLSMRYQTNSYTIKQVDQRNRSTTLGADVMVFLTRSFTFLATYDHLDGYGTVSNSVFAELSVRF